MTPAEAKQTPGRYCLRVELTDNLRRFGASFVEVDSGVPSLSLTSEGHRLLQDFCYRVGNTFMQILDVRHELPGHLIPFGEKELGDLAMAVLRSNSAFEPTLVVALGFDRSESAMFTVSQPDQLAAIVCSPHISDDAIVGPEDIGSRPAHYNTTTIAVGSSFGCRLAKLIKKYPELIDKTPRRRVGREITKT